MTSLKFILPLLTVAITTVWGLPSWAETLNQGDTIKRVPAKALGGELTPSITLFPQKGDKTAMPPSDLKLQVSGKPPRETTANPDPWESELLDEQRRSDPGFFTITTE